MDKINILNQYKVIIIGILNEFTTKLNKSCKTFFMKTTNQPPMNILKFNEHLPDEVSCILQFKEQKDRMGVICPKCGCKGHYWLQDKLRYEC
ncbi:hypothetical protein EZS27_018567, partial [termite gut metagenome]